MNARSRRTRDLLLRSARTIIERDGYDAVTVSAVAEQAGVTRRSVYLHFDTGGSLLAALFDHVAETAGLATSLQRVWDASDSTAALRAWAGHLANYHVKLLPLTLAIASAARTDPSAAAHRARVDRAQLANCRQIVRRLEDEDNLATPWTTATAVDMLWGLISDDLIAGLIDRRRWSRRKLERHLGDLLVRTFTVGHAMP
jgi:AcrR family transcriptional regulator